MESKTKNEFQEVNFATDPVEQDFPVIVQAKKIKNLRSRLAKNVAKTSTLPEFLLAITSISTGGIVGALQAGITRNSDYWWLYFVVLPIIAVGTGVSFCYSRYLKARQKSFEIQDVLNELPNPDETNNSFAYINELIGNWKMNSTTSHSKKNAEGNLTVTAKLGRLNISGYMIGESSRLIADITSLSCDFDPDKRQLIVTYRVFSNDDDGSVHVRECALSGILIRTDVAKELRIKGHWFSLFGEMDSGTVELLKIC